MCLWIKFLPSASCCGTLKFIVGHIWISVATTVALLSTSDKYFCISFTILASGAHVNIYPSITEMNTRASAVVNLNSCFVIRTALFMVKYDTIYGVAPSCVHAYLSV